MWDILSKNTDENHAMNAGEIREELAKRDEMKRLIKECKHKKIDRVLVKSVTRFARNSLECIEIIRTMQSCGVGVLFEND